MDSTAEDDSWSYLHGAESQRHSGEDLHLTQSNEDDAAGNLATDSKNEKCDEGSMFPSQMGSGRRDARVVCESFSSARDFLIPASPKMRRSTSQRGFKANVRRRTLAYSRHPLMACFLGESAAATKAGKSSSSCDSSGGSQRTFFSLIPVDSSRVNEKTGEPESPQLSCIGQVKNRHMKVAKSVEVACDLARGDISDGLVPHSTHISKTDPSAVTEKRQSFKLHKGESFRLQKEESFKLHSQESLKKLKKVESFKLRKEESFKLQKEESFKRQKEESSRLQKEFSVKLKKKEIPLRSSVTDLPQLDVANIVIEKLSQSDSTCAKQSATLVRFKREETKIEDEGKVKCPGQRKSRRYLHRFLKQKVGGSLGKAGFVCGWSSVENSFRSPKSERSESESEYCEIDLSRFASAEFPPKTPSFKDTRSNQHGTGKKLPEIRMRCNQLVEGATKQRLWKEEMKGKGLNDVRMDSSKHVDKAIPRSNITIKCPPSAVILQPATEAALWKRRSMPRPLGGQTESMDEKKNHSA